MRKSMYSAKLLVFFCAASTFAAEFYVSPDGSDANPGTKDKPFGTLSRARDAVRQARKIVSEPVTVYLRGGSYYLSETLVFTPQDSGTQNAPIVYTAYKSDKPVISGGIELDLKWQPYKDGIFKAKVARIKGAKLSFDQLFINGKRQIRARYPDYDMSDPGKSGYIHAAGTISDDARDPKPGANDDMTFSGAAARGIAFDPKTFTRKKWARPNEAIIHIFQRYYWGNLQWRIKDVDWGKHFIWFGEGGWQMGGKYTTVASAVDAKSRFYIENVFEELDTPGEWYLDKADGILYYMPTKGVNIKTALVEVPVLQQVVRFVGTQDEPVHHITLAGLRIAHTASTFLEQYSIPSLSDWAIHRGGSVFFEGARHCTIKNCWFDAVGGNAVFMNNYNRDNVVTGCKFTETGDSAILFVGSLELTNGTRRSFPYECQATNNLIHDCGVFGKQIAGVYISRAKRITVAHNLIYNMPRAGICIGDGTWGGHVIEYNHVHDTCRETGDHGPFNAWGRDKYWCLTQSHGAYTKDRSHDAGNVLVDAMEPVIIRNNFFEETSGWGIDLDDGASNYEIYNNLCVGVSMKLREGAYRTIYNNIWANSVGAVAFHLGYEDNHDRYFRNITVTKGASIYAVIAPPAKGPWLKEVDYNCFYSGKGNEFRARVAPRGEKGRGDKRNYSLKEWRQLGFDQHSVFADPMFVDPENNDYRVKPESPALKLGFKNFPMDQFGLLPSFSKKWRN